jgi:hypothetical protein
MLSHGKRVYDKKPPLSAGLLEGMTVIDIRALRRLGAALALTAITAGFSPALAQQPAPGAPAMGFSNSMTQRPAGSPAAKYEDAATQRSFVMQRSGDMTLMKYDDSPEVLALRANSAQRGDDFLRTDAGRVIARVTEQGNMIVYPSGNTNGVPADRIGVASPFNTPPMPASLTSATKDTAQRLSKIVGHEVTMFGAGEFSSQSAWAADAMMVVVRGVERAMKETPQAAKNLRAVNMKPAKTAIAAFGNDGELEIGVNPAQGYAGRPSSEAIAQAMQVIAGN